MASHYRNSHPPDLEFFIGLMTGTSLDALDGVLVGFAHDALQKQPLVFEVQGFCSQPFDATLQHTLLSLQAPTHNELEIALLAANQLVDAYAQVVNTLLSRTQLSASQVRAIGAHGQTVRHRPDLAYTLQLNAPARLAEQTQIDVVADFRSRDIAAGGQGAPLVPAFHAAVFATGQARAIVNIGGMANVSLLPAYSIPFVPEGSGFAGENSWMQCKAQSGSVTPPRLCNAAMRPQDHSQAGIFGYEGYIPFVPEGTGFANEDGRMQCKAQNVDGSLTPSRLCNAAMRPQDRSQVGIFGYEGYKSEEKARSPMVGFDSGPGNVLLDYWALVHTNKAYDEQGQWARQGCIDKELLAYLIASEPYFQLPPPKSTGRDVFNPDWLAVRLQQYGKPLAAVDVQATLVELTAYSIAQAVFAPNYAPTELVVCGGGALNVYLMARLQHHLNTRAAVSEIRLISSDSLGIPAQQVEALAFAWLAHQHVHQQRANLPEVTGAAGPRILGAYYPR